MRKIIKRIIPSNLKKYYNNFLLRRNLNTAYKYDLKRHFLYSVSNNDFKDSYQLLSRIILEYHSIEKGLTMPNPKIGFGQSKIIDLCRHCCEFLTKYNQDDQVDHAIGVIREYTAFQIENNFTIDQETQNAIDDLFNLRYSEPTIQVELSNREYFEHRFSNFHDFAFSRRSLRNLTSTVISTERVNNVLDLATTTPSSCNRQATRTYCITDPQLIVQLLNLQGGNKGFGHLIRNLIVITANLGAFNHVQERNQAFIDGGMYAMNLLYSFHFFGIGACILNCSGAPSKDRKMRKLCNIPDSEVLISIIIYGEPAENFKTPISKRLNTTKTNKWINKKE